MFQQIKSLFEHKEIKHLKKLRERFIGGKSTKEDISEWEKSLSEIKKLNKRNINNIFDNFNDIFIAYDFAYIDEEGFLVEASYHQEKGVII